jgi:hypothetical protein
MLIGKTILKSLWRLSTALRLIILTNIHNQPTRKSRNEYLTLTNHCYCTIMALPIEQITLSMCHDLLYLDN